MLFKSKAVDAKCQVKITLDNDNKTVIVISG